MVWPLLQAPGQHVIVKLVQPGLDLVRNPEEGDNIFFLYKCFPIFYFQGANILLTDDGDVKLGKMAGICLSKYVIVKYLK